MLIVRESLIPPQPKSALEKYRLGLSPVPRKRVATFLGLAWVFPGILEKVFHLILVMTTTEERGNNPKLSGQMEEYFTNHAIFPEIAGEFPF